MARFQAVNQSGASGNSVAKNKTKVNKHKHCLPTSAQSNYSASAYARRDRNGKIRGLHRERSVDAHKNVFVCGNGSVRKFKRREVR